MKLVLVLLAVTVVAASPVPSATYVGSPVVSPVVYSSGSGYGGWGGYGSGWGSGYGSGWGSGYGGWGGSGWGSGYGSHSTYWGNHGYPAVIKTTPVVAVTAPVATSYSSVLKAPSYGYGSYGHGGYGYGGYGLGHGTSYQNVYKVSKPVYSGLSYGLGYGSGSYGYGSGSGYGHGW